MAKPPDEQLIIPETLHGQRIDKALGHMIAELSRGQIQKRIENGEVRFNGKILTSAKQKVSTGDRVDISVVEQVERLHAQQVDFEILHEDESIAVINKPAGLVVHPGAGQKDGTLVNGLLHIYGESFVKIGQEDRPGIVHRLDKDTSGIMVVARTNAAYKALVKAMAAREITRIYHALVWGVPDVVKDRIDMPIGRNSKNRQKMMISDEGREAVTDYKVLRSYGQSLSLLECRLLTGRTHQIRVHCQAIGHPVVGDRLYGIQPTKARSLLKKDGFDQALAEEILAFPRQALHAVELQFSHPETTSPEKFLAEYPADFKRLLEKSDNP